MQNPFENIHDSRFRNGKSDGSLHDNEAKENNYLSVEKQIDEIIDAIVDSPLERAFKTVMGAIDDGAADDYLDDIRLFKTFFGQVVACDQNLLKKFHEKRSDEQMLTMFHLVPLLVATSSVQTTEELEVCEHSVAALMSMLETNPFHDYCAQLVKATFKMLNERKGLTPQYLKFE